MATYDRGVNHRVDPPGEHELDQGPSKRLEPCFDRPHNARAEAWTHAKAAEKSVAAGSHPLKSDGVTDFVTVLTSADGKILTKRHTATETIGYDRGLLFTSKKVAIKNLRDLAELVQKIGANQCVIHGTTIEGLAADQPHYRRVHERPDEPATYADAAHRWLLVDLDIKEPVPLAEWLGKIAAGRMPAKAREALPPELHDVACFALLSSSAGIKPGIHARLGFWLDRPLTGDEKRRWLEQYHPAIDRAIYRPVEPVFLAAPIFDGRSDPINDLGIKRFHVIRGERRVVAVPDIPAAPERPRSSASEGGTADDDNLMEWAEAIPNDDVEWDEWNNMGMRFFAASAGSSAGFDAFCAWSAKSEKHDTDECDARWQHWERSSPPNATGAGTLYKLAVGAGWVPSQYQNIEPAANTFDAYLQKETPDPFAPRQLSIANMFADCDDWPERGRDRSRKAKPLEELIPGFAEKHVVTYLEGAGGIGKSLIALQDAVCISAGCRLYGETVTQAAALYLNYEEPAEEFDRRLERLDEFYGANKDIRGFGQPAPNLDNFHHWQLKQHPRPFLAVKADGSIWLTRFGCRLLFWVAQHRDSGWHTFIVFDGIIDAIAFEGNTRNDDNVARHVIAELDRLALEYDFSAYAILHPSRAGERSGTGSYAPAWSTKPRAIQTFSRVNLAGGKKVDDHTPRSQVGVRRFVLKRSHGTDGEHVDLKYDRGSFQPTVQRCGGEDAIDVAVEFALSAAARGMPIRRDGKSSVNGAPLVKKNGEANNGHVLIEEYRERTGKQHGAKHFLDQLAIAEKEGRLKYEPGGSHRQAGFRPITEC